MMRQPITVSSRVNIGLAFFLIVLGVIVYIGMTRVADNDIPVEERLMPFADIKAEEIGTIRLELRNKDSVQLEYHDDRWLITEPVELETDSVYMKAFLDKLRDMQLQWLVNVSDKKELYFQEQPAGRLIVADRELLFGKHNPLDYQRYLQYNDKIYLAQDEILALVQEDLFFADRRLWPYPLPPQTIRKDGQTWQESFSERWQQVALAWQNARAVKMKKHDEEEDLEAAHLLSAMSDSGTWIEYRVMEQSPDLILVRVDLGVRYYLPESHLNELIPAINHD